MKAVQVTQFGDPSVLAMADLPDPTPGVGEITIDVSHAAVGLVDTYFRQGAFKDLPGMAHPPFVPGLEVAGRVREVGVGVTGFRVGERVVAMSGGSGTGGYASIFVAKAAFVISIEASEIDSALAVSVIPNAAMAYVALTSVAHLQQGESVLVHGALGGFSAAFPGIAKRLGASRVVGTVRASKLGAAANTLLPYDQIVDSNLLPGVLDNEKFDVIIDPVGGVVRSHSFALMRPGSRLIVAGNASGDWEHQVRTNDLWLGSMTVSGYNSGAYLRKHPQLVQPALLAALQSVEAGLGQIAIDTLTFDQVVQAHELMESRALNGRIVLVP
jgi:NADPH2:quinone reductase